VSQSRAIKPPPPNFCQAFVKGGWRAAERMYGSRTDVIVNWYHICGGKELGQMAYRFRSGEQEMLERAREMDRLRRAPAGGNAGSALAVQAAA
jgi:hypothetical protein